MKYADLTPAMKAQVDAELDRVPTRTSQRVAHAQGTSRWRCATCGELFSAWARAERHDPAHVRIECCL